MTNSQKWAFLEAILSVNSCLFALQWCQSGGWVTLFCFPQSQYKWSKGSLFIIRGQTSVSQTRRIDLRRNMRNSVFGRSLPNENSLWLKSGGRLFCKSTNAHRRQDSDSTGTGPAFLLISVMACSPDDNRTRMITMHDANRTAKAEPHGLRGWPKVNAKSLSRSSYLRPVL